MQQAGSGSRRTCGAPDLGSCREHDSMVGSDAGPGFRVPASDRPRMWSGETRSCEHHALRFSSKEVVEAGFKWNGVGHHGAQFPALGGLYAKVAREGPWFVPFWRGPRLGAGPAPQLPRCGNLQWISLGCVHDASPYIKPLAVGM